MVEKVISIWISQLYLLLRTLKNKVIWGLLLKLSKASSILTSVKS